MLQSRILRQDNIKNSYIIQSVNLNVGFKLMNRDAAFEQLAIKYDSNNKQDVKELTFILSKLLSYPSSDAAFLHMEANRLGRLDHVDHSDEIVTYIEKDNQFCPCCGLIKQVQTLPICTNLKDVHNIGISTYLFFQTLKHVILLLTVLFFVYGVYAIVSNIVSANIYREAVPDLTDIKRESFKGILVISLGSKQLNQTQSDKISFMIQCWLGVGLIAIWGVLFAVIKYRERIGSLELRKTMKRASDFTIFIKNFPKNMTNQELEDQLNQFYSNRRNIDDIYKTDQKVKVVKINKAIPFYLDKESIKTSQLIQITNNYNEYKKIFAGWIKQRSQRDHFSTTPEQRKATIQQYSLVKKNRMAVFTRNAENIKKLIVQSSTHGKQIVPVFVTFQNTLTKESLAFIHQDADSFFNIFLCKKQKTQKYFHFKNKDNDDVVMAKIKKAPEPEDIIWTNLGRTFCMALQKKFITYSVTLVVLGISFGAVYGLSKVQYDYTQANQGASIQYLSIFISLVISTLNVLIQQVLRFVTKMQNSTTNTQYQISMAIKAVIALLINNIVIPILVNRFFEDNLYGVNGLAYDVFYLGITNSFLSPLIRIFDIEYYFFRLVKIYQNRPNQKLLLNQQKLNFHTQHIEFELGYEHIYVINLFLFVCFFCSLQPIIIVFAITGLVIMFWAQKNALFNRSRRPVPSNNVVNTAMHQLIFMGPAFYTIGSFCWSHFFEHQFIGIAPNLVAAILSFIIFLTPYKKIIKIFNKKKQRVERQYEKEKIFIGADYDRFNPATAQQAVQQYLQMVQTKRKALLEKRSSSQFIQFQRQYIKTKAQNTIIKKYISSERDIDEKDQRELQADILRKSLSGFYAPQLSHIKKDNSFIRQHDIRSSMPICKIHSYNFYEPGQNSLPKKAKRNSYENNVIHEVNSVNNTQKQMLEQKRSDEAFISPQNLTPTFVQRTSQQRLQPPLNSISTANMGQTLNAGGDIRNYIPIKNKRTFF